MFAQQNTGYCPSKQKIRDVQTLKWTFLITDYVEWVYGLCEILNLNGGKTSLNTLFNIFNSIFDMKITAFYQYFKSIRDCKKKRASIFELQEQLIRQRMEKADMKAPGK